MEGQGGPGGTGPLPKYSTQCANTLLEDAPAKAKGFPPEFWVIPCKKWRKLRDNMSLIHLVARTYRAAQQTLADKS